jgi:hypothetical protein
MFVFHGMGEAAIQGLRNVLPQWVEQKQSPVKILSMEWVKPPFKG